MRKFIVLTAVIGIWAASSSSALAGPTLTLSGTCQRDVGYPTTDLIFDSLYVVEAEASGLAPNTSYAVLIVASRGGNLVGTRTTDATGTFSFGSVLGITQNPPPSVTFGPPRPSCADFVRQAEAAGNLRHGEARSLLAKLKSAEKSASSGKSRGARNKLTAFIHEVRAIVRSRRLSPALGHRLVDCAEAEIARLARHGVNADGSR